MEYVKKFIVDLSGEKFTDLKKLGEYLHNVGYSLGFVLTTKAPNLADFIFHCEGIDVYRCRYTGNYSAYEEITDEAANELIQRFGRQITE